MTGFEYICKDEPNTDCIREGEMDYIVYLTCVDTKLTQA